MPELGADEIALIVPLLGAVGLYFVVSLVLWAWGRWVARRHPTRAWRSASWMPIGALVGSTVGMCGSTFFLIRGFGALADVPPSERSAALADSISFAMTFTALITVPAFLLYVASIITFAVGTLKRPTEPT